MVAVGLSGLRAQARANRQLGEVWAGLSRFIADRFAFRARALALFARLDQSCFPCHRRARGSCVWACAGNRSRRTCPSSDGAGSPGHRPADSWRANGSYAGASEIIRDAVLHYQATSSKRGSRNLIVMTVHRAKGREFDEVIVYEERYEPLLKLTPTRKDLEPARSALNVAVTRAKKRSTIITPLNAPSPRLTLKLDHVVTS